MSEEIYINTGTTIQQPYQGQSVRNAQNAETRQTTAQTPANAQTPFTYQNRQPTTYRNPVNSQEPNIRNAQTPFTYQRTGRVPFIYTHRSPFTYQRTGQTPFTYNNQQPYPFITTVPYTYNSTGTATVYPLEQTWYPTGFTLRDTGNLNQAQAGRAYVRKEIRAAVDTANDRIIIDGKSKTLSIDCYSY